MKRLQGKDKGAVLWLTGLSGAGKTTIARRTVELIRELGGCPVLLDGDMVREAINDKNCGHDRAARLENAYRICRLAALLAGQGHLVIVSTMSLFHEVHEWNRRNLPGYYEVLVQVDIETARERDPKGLYARIANGDERNMPGVDLTPEFPLAPHLVLENNENLGDVKQIALRLHRLWTNHLNHER